MNDISYIKNSRLNQQNPEAADLFSEKEIKEIYSYHNRIPAYSPTHLHSLSSLGHSLNLSGIFVKDESSRFRLKAFKALGASYAVGKILGQKLNCHIDDISFDMLKEKEIKTLLGEQTFITTTDGNHGMGVAWTAKQIEQKAIVYMPKGSSERRVNNILSTGAEVHVTDFNYDDTVAITAQLALDNNWILVQDTAWDGYEDIPTLIMKGYATMFEETFSQLNGTIPTHIFIQAGVGTLAASLQSYLLFRFPVNPPKLIVLEAQNADCFYQSIINDGDTYLTVGGNHETIMAGLACGKPNTLAWDILRSCSYAFMVCSDEITKTGMNLAAHPEGDDPSFVSGESGAVGLGLVKKIMADDNCRDIRKDLDITNSSSILLFSTEGATDPAVYESIVTPHPQG